MPGFTIDMTQAKKLPNTGATCDVYEYRYGSRRLLIKRIKEAYRGKTTLFSTFEKEFEIWLNLNHKSLPVYRFAGHGFIAMDYVDGKTLSAIIAEKDPWLAEAGTIRRMPAQLVDVIDYLHQKIPRGGRFRRRDGGIQHEGLSDDERQQYQSVG